MCGKVLNLVTKEMQIKSTKRYPYMHTSIATFKENDEAKS